MRTKTNEFKIRMAGCDYDIVVLTETWLRPDVVNAELASNYCIFRCDRNNNTSTFQRGGGVLIAVKPTHRCSAVTLTDSSHLEQIAVAVNLPGSTVYVCGIYIRPNSHPDVYMSHSNAVQQICDRSLSTDTIVVVGDYNLPHLSWHFDEDCNSYLPWNASSESEISFTESIIASGLHQLNSLRNANGRILDLAFVSESSYVELIEPPSSLLKIDPHHKPFVIRLETEAGEQILMAESNANAFDFKRCDFTVLNSVLAAVDWNVTLGDGSLDHITACFYSKVHDIIRTHVPRRRRCLAMHSKLPWWTPELRHLRNVVRKARTRFFRMNSRYNKDRLKTLEKRYNKAQENAYRSYTNRLESNFKRDPKSFWAHIKALKSINRIPEKLTYNDATADNSETSANLFADFFSSVHSSHSPTFSSSVRQNVQSFNIRMPMLLISQSEIASALKKLDVSKGAGTDRIPPLFLKECADALKFPISLIFNRSLRDRTFPEVWKVASITPIHKSGSIHAIENYRGISILCSIAKVFEEIIHVGLYNAVRPLISEAQHGFVKQRSTVSNLMSFMSVLSDNVERRRQVDTIYFDFSKAFDKVPHELAINKLQHTGLPAWITEWLRSYLTERKAFVKVGNARSRMYCISSGVPQGSVLGPLIFVLFINDLATRLKSGKLLYADDLKIYREISSTLDCCALDADVSELVSWCAQNGMELNICKCKVITFTRRQSYLSYDYAIGTNIIERVNSIRDLGVIIDSKLKFTEHIGSVSAKGFAVLGFIRRNSRAFRDVYTLKALYCSLVRSILEYAVCVWSPYHTTHKLTIEKVQRCFIRYALRLLPWNDPFHLPDYVSRCRLIDLETLEARRTKIQRLFVFDLLSNNIDCSELVNELRFYAPTRQLRERQLLASRPHRTTYGQNCPLSSSFRAFNDVGSHFDFNVSKCVFKRRIKYIR